MTVSHWFKVNKWGLALCLVICALVYSDIVMQMVSVWANNDDYSHGFLVPFISGYFFWMSRQSILDSQVRPTNWGLAVIICGLCLLVFGSVATEYFTTRASLVVMVIGAVIYVLGWDAFKAMWMPLLYLFLMIPIPAIVYDSLTMPLKLFVAKISVKGLFVLGYPVLRQGNIIMLPNITLEVADACSGLRSLMSLIALSVAFAFLSQRSTLKRWVLIVSALPVAMVTNVLRVLVTGILAKHYGRVVAEGFFHEFAGVMVFLVAMILMAILGFLLKRKEKQYGS